MNVCRVCLLVFYKVLRVKFSISCGGFGRCSVSVLLVKGSNGGGGGFVFGVCFGRLV